MRLLLWKFRVLEPNLELQFKIARQYQNFGKTMQTISSWWYTKESAFTDSWSNFSHLNITWISKHADRECLCSLVRRSSGEHPYGEVGIVFVIWLVMDNISSKELVTLIWKFKDLVTSGSFYFYHILTYSVFFGSSWCHYHK